LRPTVRPVKDGDEPPRTPRTPRARRGRRSDRDDGRPTADHARRKAQDVTMNPSAQPPNSQHPTPNTSFRVIGRRLRRPDARPRLTGQERYAGDLALPGMLHACLVLSVHAHARIHRIDAAAALAHPGVGAVLTAADLPPFARDDAPTERTRFFL